MAKSKSSGAKPRLGRGLSSLISNSSSEAQNASGVSNSEVLQDASVSNLDGQPQEIPVGDISPNPYQPRKEFRSQQLQELAESIRQQGILQPLLVVKVSDPSAPTPYALIAGERRLRAAELAGLETVPCIVRKASQQQMLEWAIIENIHRTDLNPIEKALAYRQYLDRFRLTHETAAKELGQPRTTISNHLRLLDLPDTIQALIRDRHLSFGHAKVIAGLSGQPDLQNELARQTVTNALSVRQLEAMAYGIAAETASPEKPQTESPRPNETPPAYVQDLEERLTAVVGTQVQIYPNRNKNSGVIAISYYSLDDFDRIAALLGLPREA